MSPKKKKGKGSRLARMSEEEKLRYFQHRAEIELEARRRKQQLIATFTKNKLKYEEAFSRLNIAKINEQWRFQLRQIKCKELYDVVEYSSKYFDTALRAKNAVIDQLYQKLISADIAHRKLQANHVRKMDEIINNYSSRLDKWHESYMKSVMEIQCEELRDIDYKKNTLYRGCEFLKIITFAQTIFLDGKLMKTKVRNAINTNTVAYSKEEDGVDIEKAIRSKLNSLRSILNDVIIDYQHEMKNKRKNHDSLVQRDTAHQIEVSHFPGFQLKLTQIIETLKYRENILMLGQKEIVSEFENQIRMTNEGIFELRRDMNMNQTIDEIQLKKQIVVSNNIIGYLKKLGQRSSSLVQLIKMCLCFEQLLSIVDENNIHYSDGVTESNMSCAIISYDKLGKFWHQYNSMKTENIFMKSDHYQLITENSKLRDCLRSYLIAIAQVKSIKSPICNWM